MFKAVKAQNLFAWKNLEYVVKPGISQITGWNLDDNRSEGSGKSSILNIFSWTCFGECPKDVKIDEVVRENTKKAWGEVELNDGHKIKRSRKPNDLVIITPSGEEKRGSDAKETQSMILKLLGLSFETFTQAVYFSQGNERKFITASEKDKLSIISEILDLNRFDKAREAVLGFQRQAKKELGEVESKISTHKEFIEQQQEILESFKKSKKNFEAEKAEKVENLESKLSELQKDSENLLSIQKKLPSKKSVQERLKQLQTMNSDLSGQLGEHKATLKRLRFAAENEECPTCGTPVTGHEKAVKEGRAVEAQISAVKKEVQTVIDATREEDKIVEKTRKVEQTRSEILSKLESVEQRLEQVKETKFSGHEVYEKAKEQKKKSAGKLEKLQEALEKVQKDLNFFADLREGYKTTKALVMRNFLVSLSKKATENLSHLFDIDVQIQFTNSSDTGEVGKIRAEATIEGVPRNINLYSGGQFKRVELATDLALAHLISQRSEKHFNFRAFDEPFKDLSEKSMEGVLELFKTLPGNTVIIEHNSMVKSVIENSFHVELSGGVSRAVS